VAASMMLVYLSTFSLAPMMWITFFWLMMLFAAINALAKSFIQDSFYCCL